MSKLIKTTMFALVVAAILLAFRGPDQQRPTAPPANRNQDTIVRYKQVPPPDTLGREVDLELAQQCIRRFAVEMSRRGFTGREGEKLKQVKMRKAQMITTGEVFSGRRLLEWLRSMDDLYSQKNLTVHLNVQMGIYTDEFLKVYHPDDEKMRRKLENRIGVFMIPLDSASKMSIDEKGDLRFYSGEKPYQRTVASRGPNQAAKTADTTDAGAATRYFGGGGKGYDLGGIQP